MRKFLKLIVISATISLLSNIAVFAGQWTTDNIGHRYQNDDGSYIASNWINHNGQWYYLNENGYMAANTWIGNYYVGADGVMLTNTITPDGYQVGADGAWIQPAGFPRAPYADLIKLYPNYLESVNAIISFSNPNALIDHGTYYEIPNQCIEYWYDGEWGVEAMDIYFGSLYFYKDLTVTGEYSYPSIIDAINSYPYLFDKYTFSLFYPDENGYFTKINVGAFN